MKIVIQIIILSFIVGVFPHYSYAQEGNQALKVPPKLQATVEEKEKVYSDEGASIKEEIAYLKGRINALEKMENVEKRAWDIFFEFLAWWIAIFVALFSTAGVFAYKWLRREVLDEIKESHDDAINKAYATTDLLLSYLAWYEYKPSYFRGAREDFYLDYGIRHAERALKWTDKIQEKQESDMRKLILECKNHLACYLTERGSPNDTKKALDIAKELKRCRTEFKNPPLWDDTISFVFIRFGNPAEKEEGLRLRDELISREKELGSDFVYAVKAKYKTGE